MAADSGVVEAARASLGLAPHTSPILGWESAVDPLNGSLGVVGRFTPTTDELKPHMGDWGPYGHH